MERSWRLWGALLAAVLLATALLGRCSTPHWGPGVVVPEVPVQKTTSRSPWEHGGFSISPLAEFTVRARVLGVKKYSGSGLESQLSPVDVALGWGAMSDEQVLGQLKITQGGRWYRYRWDDSPPLPVRQIIQSSANMHLVPASEGVGRALKELREGDVVVIEGALIQARGPRGWVWRSSTTRNDSGEGSCELVWVESVSIEPAPLD